MNREVTDKNLYLLLPGKVLAVAKICSEQKGISVLEALQAFYSSETYRKLEQERTKYWHLGPVALYEDFIHASSNVCTILQRPYVND